MEIEIKAFNELSREELYKIIAARINVFVVEQDCPYEECDNKDQESFHLFFHDNNEIAAYLRIIPAGLSYSVPSIGRVMVKKAYRRQGLATKMMKEAISFIKNNFNQKEIRISAQEYIIDFYKNLGFKVLSDRYLEDGIPHYEMRYKL